MNSEKKCRRLLIAGNWKMNCDINSAKDLLGEILDAKINKTCDVIVCVPAVSLYVASKILNGSQIHLGAQNCHWEKSGAFTGEISSSMLKSVGTEYVIIGHSERRSLFGETDQTVNKRLTEAVNSGIKVILCVGENLFERQNKVTFERLSLQVKMALLNVDERMIKNVIIAYEPVWAIGTNKSATEKQANEACAHIRFIIKEIYGNSISDNVLILYGGSLNSENVGSIFSQSDIDGGLIGGASINPFEFKKIIKVANSL